MREMKDSGVEWIGEIPSDCNVFRNKNAFVCSKELVGDKFSETQLLSLTTKGIRLKDINNAEGKLPESFDTYQYVKENELVMCLFDLDCSAVFSGISPYAGMISPAYRVLTCTNRIVPKYADYWFQYISHGRKFNHYAKNIRYTLSYEEFSSLPMLFPDIEEQKRISDYLDAKCAKIDSIIEKQQIIIEKLKEYKLSVITEAVTKGLDNSIEMVSCDAGWTNVMPMGWISAPIKKVTEFITCGVAATPEYTDENNGFLFLSAQNVKDGKMDYSVKRYIVPELHESLTKKRKPRRGDILQVRVGATIGNAAVVDTDEPYSVYVSLTHMRTNEMVTPEYFKYSLSNSLFQQKAMSFVDFAGSQGNLNVADMKKLKILVPTIEEQAQIVEFLNKKCDGIDEMISNRSKIVEKLQEYKKSIIYEVVTGKKEV